MKVHAFVISTELSKHNLLRAAPHTAEEHYHIPFRYDPNDDKHNSGQSSNVGGGGSGGTGGRGDSGGGDDGDDDDSCWGDNGGGDD